MSSATVVGNSILLVRYRPRFVVTKPKTEQVYSEKAFKETYALTT